MEGLEHLVNKLDHIDLNKTEHKVIKFIAGFIAGYFLVNMASKFMDDNFSFRIAKISNLPAPTACTTSNSGCY